ncbi:hypothetical protein GA0115236_10064 [Streptomyces sp. IgraMP-1]|nr:hypothetical protein GA0115236_10064 [Streptomyces sp. IgraMP-1]
MRSEAPFTVVCASICAAVQYIVVNGGSDTTSPLISTLIRRSYPPGSAEESSR